MGKWFSITLLRDRFLRYSFSNAGLKSVTSDLGDGTVLHCWVPKTTDQNKPNLVLIHGFGANAMWQWNEFIKPLVTRFNLYLPDLVFFGDSYSTRPDRSEAFQARSVMSVMEAHGVKKMDVVGISYGGFVGYSMAAQYPDAVERLVLCCAGVCLEDKDMDDGLFLMKNVDEVVTVLLPKTPETVRELMKISFHTPMRNLPDWFLNDFIEEMYTKYRQEREEILHALHKGRKFSDLPKITQTPLLIWGEQDKIFPLEMAHRLIRHLDDKAQLVVIKDVGHALNAEKPKELRKHLESYLIDNLPPAKHENSSNGNKVLD